MFFMIGITDGRKVFDYTQTVICNICGKYGRYQVFMTYTVLSLFFIPCFKWNKRFYVQTSCCNTLYELDPEIGKRIAKGESLEIQPDDLTKVNVVNGRFCPQSVRNFCPIVAGFNAGTYKVPACVL